jgi:hypothetical protein
MFTYRYQIFCPELICSKKSKNNQDHMKKVGKDRKPQVTEKVKHLSFDNCELENKQKLVKIRKNLQIVFNWSCISHRLYSHS